jgi:hypothetical protein
MPLFEQFFVTNYKRKGEALNTEREQMKNTAGESAGRDGSELSPEAFSPAEAYL